MLQPSPVHLQPPGRAAAAEEPFHAATVEEDLGRAGGGERQGRR
jgi:hypothetical protein